MVQSSAINAVNSAPFWFCMVSCVQTPRVMSEHEIIDAKERVTWIVRQHVNVDCA